MPGQPMPPQPPEGEQLEPAELIETFGFMLGLQNGIRNFDFNDEEFESFLKGLKRAQAGEAVPGDLQSKIPQLQAYLGQRQAEVAQRKGAENRKKAEEFFAELDKEGLDKTAEGIYYKIEKQGSGETPDDDSLVVVNYEGRLIDGTVFDSSLDRDEPAEFPLSNVISGMRIGIQKIQEGGKITLYIPADEAYGDQSPPTIPAGSALIFDVELIEVKEAPAQAMPEFAPPPTP